MDKLYESLSKDELISKVLQLEAHVRQLKNVINKSKNESVNKKSAKRPFDFTKHNTRHVALKLAYLGWDYQGFAVQEDTNRTIEAELFDALIKTRLIESRQTSNYHRCGRTDKGVSAFSQVISLDLRTNLSEGTGVKKRPCPTVEDKCTAVTSDDEEIRYVQILNRVLPAEIKILAWCPVDSTFSARFSCTSRTYKYFFPVGDLNIDLMRKAAQLLIGEHDFRNLCKMDVGNGVVNYRRAIVSATLVQYDNTFNYRRSDVEDGERSGDVNSHVHGANVNDVGYQMCELTIVGQAFLWHQIRCIVSVLFLVGKQLEQPEIISELLDVVRNPRKPQYTMASELPLVLYSCSYDNCDVEWRHDSDADVEIIRTLQSTWTNVAVKQMIIRQMLTDMKPQASPLCYQMNCLVAGNQTRTYKPLMEREMCESLDDRVKHFTAKKRRRLSPGSVTMRDGDNDTAAAAAASST